MNMALPSPPEPDLVQDVSFTFSDTTYGRFFMSSLVSLRQSDQFTDVTLKAEDLEMKCHKVVLSAASPYFLAMFTSGLEESSSGFVEIKDIDGETLMSIVNYIYSSDVVITTTNVQNLIQGCELFHFKGLKQACERFMLAQVDSSNCIGFYKFAKLYGLKLLRDGARRCMLSQFRDVVTENEFSETTSAELIEYISDNHLEVRTEDPVFEAVTLWIGHDHVNRKTDSDEVMSHVRFPFCSSAYLCHVVAKNEYFIEQQQHERYLEEAWIYHMLPEKRHEMRSLRNIPRKSFSVNRTLVLLGGLTKEEKENRYCWYLKQDTASWELLAQLPKPNWKFYSVCVIPNGILMTGGYHGNVKRDCWLFDTLEKKWKVMPPMLDARCKHSAVVHGDWVYVIGGEDDFDQPLSTVERLDLRTKHWDLVPPMDKSLSDPLVVACGRHIYVFGGIENDDTTSVATLVFDTVWETWSKKTDMPEPCRLGSVVAINNHIYVVAGYSRTCLGYDPATDKWSSLSRPREKHGNAPAVVWKGKLLVAGGDIDMHETTSVVEEYKPDDNTWAYWKLPLKEELSCHYLLNVDMSGL